MLSHADGLASRPGLDPRSVRKWEAVADLAAFMSGTGTRTRIGEARAVQWEHIDFDGAFVRLHGTKSKSSRRRLDLPPWLLKRLSQRAERMAAQYLEAAANAKKSSNMTRAEKVEELSHLASRVGKTGLIFSHHQHASISITRGMSRMPPTRCGNCSPEQASSGPPLILSGEPLSAGSARAGRNSPRSQISQGTRTLR